MNGTVNLIWNGMPPVLVGLITIGLLTACSSTRQSGQNDKGSVESRGLDKMHQPMKSGMPTQPGPPTKTNVKMPTWPQKFEVQGPEVDSFGFAVTQAGPITIEVQAQGAPLVIALQSAGRPAITQPALGNTRMSYNVTPKDVQRNLFWTVQIRLAQPMPPQQGGRAAGSVNVQHPPVNQEQVQAALATQQ